MKNSPSWLPPFTLKESKRSKRITLKISQHKGLELIVPKRTSKKKAFEFLMSKLEWIKKHFSLLRPSDNTIVLPDKITLPTIGEEWQVVFSDRQKVPLKEDLAVCALRLRSDLTKEQIQGYLKKWLINKGKKYLPEILAIHSHATGLAFSSFSIRLQRSRWGSCSPEKNISLNAKLLLLPRAVTDYVIIHELCHTLHLNHSPHFWTEVAKYLPHYHLLRGDLKKLEQDLPNWLY